MSKTYRSYWDHDDTQRAALTEEQLERLVDIELMEQGVTRPLAPDYEPESAPPRPTASVFRIKYHGRRWNASLDVGFHSLDDAKAFLELRPIAIVYDGGEYCTERVEAPEVEVAEMCELGSEDAKARAAFAAARERNQKLRREYEEALESRMTTASRIYEDYRRCRAKARRLAEVRERFAEYESLAGGDRATARRFLEKAYPTELVIDALGETAA